MCSSIQICQSLGVRKSELLRAQWNDAAGAQVGSRVSGSPRYDPRHVCIFWLNSDPQGMQFAVLLLLLVLTFLLMTLFTFV